MERGRADDRNSTDTARTVQRTAGTQDDLLKRLRRIERQREMDDLKRKWHKSDPHDVVKVIRLSRATYAKMVQNLAWGTGYNIVSIPPAAGVLAPVGLILPPVIGTVVLPLSTIIAAFNAQLLRRLRRHI